MNTRQRLLSLALVACATACSAAGDPVDPAEGDAGADVAPDTTPDTAPDTTPADTGTPDTAPDTDADVETCGDGKLDPGEDCDDGNAKSGDGCDADCKFEPTGPDDVCGGKAIAFEGTGDAERTAQIKDTTEKNRHNYGGSCGGGSGKDAVYELVPDVTGKVVASVRAEFPVILYARSTCADASKELACAELLASSGTAEITFGGKAGEPFYLVVDGYGGSSGAFTLDVAVQTASCGNGRAEVPEQCDDGNTVDGDGCSSTCTLEGGPAVGTCPGTPFFLKGTGAAPRKVSFAADTTMGDDTETAIGCVNDDGRNVIYAITPDVSGSMKVEVKSEGPTGSVHVRSECPEDDWELDCAEADAALAPMVLTTAVQADQTYYVIVDADDATGSGGPFTLDVTVTPAACGNGAHDVGEECDDGNLTPGDGCDATCKVESMAANDGCGAGGSAVGEIPLTLTGSVYTGKRSGSTYGLVNDFRKCNTSTTATSGDAIYRVRSPIAGYMTATAKGDFRIALSARGVCNTTASDLACGKSAPGNGAQTVNVPVEADTDVFLVVEGNNTAAPNGSFLVDVSIAPSACGNGVVEGGETCDDSNTTAGDGCDALCQLETVTHNDCATAEQIPLTETAGVHAGSASGGTTNLTGVHSMTGCTSSGRDAFYKVTAPIDGVMTVRSTASFNASLGVRGTCATSGAPLVCSNLTTTGVEELDVSVTAGKTYWIIVDTTSSSAVPGPYSVSVAIRGSGCGDGITSGDEQCDDGNVTSGDGCSATCTLETLAGVDRCSGYAVTLEGTTGPRTARVTVDTSTLGADYASSCGGAAKDAVVVVTPPVSGTLVARVKQSGFLLHARTTCADPLTEVACKTNGLIEMPVAAGAPLYLFVDAPPGKEGQATLEISVTP